MGLEERSSYSDAQSNSTETDEASQSNVGSHTSRFSRLRLHVSGC